MSAAPGLGEADHVLDESHPHCVRTADGRLLLAADPERLRASLAAEQAWRRAAARAGTVSMPLGTALGVAAGLFVGLAIEGAAAVSAGLLLGALVGFAVGAALVWPPRPADRPALIVEDPVHPFLVVHAPPETAYPVLARWQRVLQEYDAARGYLAKGRADARLTPEQRAGVTDRTAWFYGPEDLPGLEERYAAAREAVLRLAVELGAPAPVDDP